MMMLSREVRKVPVGWNPPTDPFILMDGTQPRADLRLWKPLAAHEFMEPGDDPSDFMPPITGEYLLMAYETVSEGTPITGNAFPDTEEGHLALCEDLTLQKSGITSDLTTKQWHDVLFGDTMLMDVHTGDLR